MTRPDAAIDACLEGELTQAQAREIDRWIAADPANAAEYLHLVRTHQMLVGIGKEHRLSRDAGSLQPDQLDSITLAELAEMEANAEPLPYAQSTQPRGLEKAHLASNKRQSNAHRSSQHLSSEESITISEAMDALRWAADNAAVRLIRSPYGITAAVAALLLLGVLLLSPWQTRDDPRTPQMPLTSTPSTPSGSDAQVAVSSAPVATLTATYNADWAGPASAAPAQGDTLRPNQRLTLAAGFAEITTNRGAIAILEAPATIELLDNDNALRLHAGKLVGICETESAKGFVVRTPYMDITDIGTEFGVSATPGGVEANVFVGKIEVKAAGAPARVIAHSQTARVLLENQEPTLVVEDKTVEGFTRRLPREPLVSAAYINDDRFSVQVANQSLFEDAKIHTDRDHEINGIDARGLPQELLGADVIRTPGDARPGINQRTENLRIEIETTRPAEVYLVLWEGGETLPAWINRDYVKTDMTVGIDYGPSHQTTASLGVGPGESIDVVHSVWQRKQTVEGRALVAEEMTRLTAYVILAVPVQ